MHPRILIVDDEEDALQLLGYKLREAGYCVFTAGTGLEALNKAREFLPDVMVLDLMLPELDGIAVCEILQKQPSTKKIPILMLTSWASEDAKVIGLQTGASDYMVKPFSPRELITRLGKLLERPNGLVVNNVTQVSPSCHTPAVV